MILARATRRRCFVMPKRGPAARVVAGESCAAALARLLSCSHGEGETRDAVQHRQVPPRRLACASTPSQEATSSSAFTRRAVAALCTACYTVVESSRLTMPGAFSKHARRARVAARVVVKVLLPCARLQTSSLPLLCSLLLPGACVCG